MAMEDLGNALRAAAQNKSGSVKGALYSRIAVMVSGGVRSAVPKAESPNPSGGGERTAVGGDRGQPSRGSTCGPQAKSVSRMWNRATASVAKVATWQQGAIFLARALDSGPEYYRAVATLLAKRFSADKMTITYSNIGLDIHDDCGELCHLLLCVAGPSFAYEVDVLLEGQLVNLPSICRFTRLDGWITDTDGVVPLALEDSEGEPHVGSTDAGLREIYCPYCRNV